MQSERLTKLKIWISNVLGIAPVPNPNNLENFARWRLPSGRLELVGDNTYQIYLSLATRTGGVEFELRHHTWRREVFDRDGRAVYRDLDSAGNQWHTYAPEKQNQMQLLATFLSILKTDSATLHQPLSQLMQNRQRTRDSSPVRKPARRTKLTVAELCN